MIGQRLLHYEIVEKLGEGGMGVVYKARDTNLDRFVALKFLPPERVADAERRRWFFREARAASALNHPNIITIHEINQAGGADFIAMEYVSGRTLAEMIAGKPLPPKDALHLALQAADALAAAHREGIIHRDLKPGNMMVTAEGRLKILDFGLAKPAEAAPAGNESTLTMVAGTAAYMPPEQAEGRPADARSDIYSLGAVLYEMLAGRKAFAGFTREEPPPLRDAPAGWQEVVSRCLRPNPGERFQSAAELKAALERTAGEPRSNPSIAVLPFANLSADKENEYFGDGLAEEIINALTKVPGLRVPARTSSFVYRGKEMDVGEIGARLKVGHVLEGSVRRAGERIRVTAQLINVADGYHLWSERYDRELSDVFAIQDEIARAVVDKLSVELVGPEPLIKRRTMKLEAYTLYLQGRHWWNQFTSEGCRRAVECMERAIHEDAGYALPYAGLAITHAHAAMLGFARPRAVMPEARKHALKALELEESLAEAHLALAMVRHWYEWDLRGAEAVFRRAVSLSPRDAMVRFWYSEVLLHQGREEEALAEGECAAAMEPVSPEINRLLTRLYAMTRRDEQAIAQGLRTVELHPHYGAGYLNLGLAYIYCARYEDAIRTLQTATELTRGDPLYDWCLAFAYAGCGHRAEAGELLAALERRGYSPLYISLVYAALGDSTRAFELMETAYRERESCLVQLAVEPAADMLRADPRFADLLRRVRPEAK
jgi:TolB-like protein/predicted Ser/Thr protein kinase/Flp pilus assembly protein TadD